MPREFLSNRFVLDENGIAALELLQAIQPTLIAWYVVVGNQKRSLNEVNPRELISPIKVACVLPEGMAWREEDEKQMIVITDASLVLFSSLIAAGYQQAFNLLWQNIQLYQDQ